jgi:hypothetical protein
MTFRCNSLSEGATAWREDAPALAARGMVLPDARGYLPEVFKSNFAAAQMAMDAQPALSTAPNSSVPAFLTNWVDPEVVEIRFAANMMAEIFTEEKKGDWTTQTAFFPVVEHTGEVSSYGDYNENGSSGANVNWPQRQSYLYQTFKEYGELELDRMGLAKLSWVAEQDRAAALAMNKYENLTYAFGVAGLQNYGALNDPNLPASLSPAPKSYGGSKWIVNGAVVASANEIFSDIQSMFLGLTVQSNGLIDAKSEITLAMAPSAAMALTTTNSFNVNVEDLLKKNFPKLTVKTAVQYGQSSSTNNQGIAAGNLVQMVAKTVEGQKTASVSFNEKMRAHKIVVGSSSYRQKLTGGTWGAVVKQPFAISSMLGV